MLRLLAGIGGAFVGVRAAAARSVFSPPETTMVQVRVFFPKDVISGYSKQEAWARGKGDVTGIFGPNRTYKVQV